MLFDRAWSRLRPASPISSPTGRPTRGSAQQKIAIVGLGYVGSVTGACLADAGHDVTFVEVNHLKVAQLTRGRSIQEKELPALIRQNNAQGRLRATDDLGAAVADANTVIVCVGTPTGRNGDVHLRDLEKVCLQIGQAIAERNEWLLVVITSTIPPGTTQDLIIPRLEDESGKTCGADFGVVFSPEFLREGSAVADFRHPEVTILGASDDQALRAAIELYAPFGGQVDSVPVRVAETVKLVGNAWHALKVVFANEVGRFCESETIDSRIVMDIFKQDRRLNVSPAYLNPGFAFGGSCLPKDLRTLNYRARLNGVDMPVLDNVLRSNQAHIDLAVRRIEEYGARRIAVLGLAFKHGTDDLRESPTSSWSSDSSARGTRCGCTTTGSGCRVWWGEPRVPDADPPARGGVRRGGPGRGDPRCGRDRGGSGQQGLQRHPRPGHPESEGAGPARRGPGGRRRVAPVRRVPVVNSQAPADRPGVLILVQNLPVPFDRRVWQEACALRDNGFDVSVICPSSEQYPALEESSTASTCTGTHRGWRPGGWRATSSSTRWPSSR